MLIRVEIPVDAAGIDQLLRNAFPPSEEAELVHRLREDGLLTLGVVATDEEGGVVGYAAFSPVYVDGEDRQCVGLAPVVVDEAHRRQGLAEKIIYEGLDSLNEFGYSAVVVLGEPAYFSRFGFQNAAEHGLHSKLPGTEASFQVYPLADGEMENCKGVVEYSAPFGRG